MHKFFLILAAAAALLLAAAIPGQTSDNSGYAWKQVYSKTVTDQRLLDLEAREEAQGRPAAHRLPVKE